MVAAAQAHLGKAAALVSHKINDRMTWAEFYALVVQAVQPPLGMIATLKKIKQVKFSRDLDGTLGKIQHLTLEAYPQATQKEPEQHTFSARFNLMPVTIKDYFTIHDPRGLDQDIITIRRLLTTINTPD